MFYNQHTTYRQRTYAEARPRRIGIFRVLLHTFLVVVTHGLWLIVLGVRYMLRRL
jgi:hypothetical protein